MNEDEILSVKTDEKRIVSVSIVYHVKEGLDVGICIKGSKSIMAKMDEEMISWIRHEVIDSIESWGWVCYARQI